MIFGLSFATFLTLILVPAMYLLTERAKARWNRFMDRIMGRSEAPKASE
jgi:ABC-type sulfate transport system permease component